MKKYQSGFALGLLVAIGGMALAELPPAAYKEMQDNAPEYLQIQVQKVETKTTKKGDETTTSVRGKATVKKVVRSASK